VNKFDTSDINAKIRQHWWDNYSEDDNSSFHYYPLQYPSLHKQCFLFVGLNPSLKCINRR